MSTPDSIAELGPLPQSDRNAELQQTSIAALRYLLPPERFLFRDERVDDAGVDGSLELLIEGRYTNLRSQVQLKSTDSKKAKSDGTISIPVATSNLNYLLNGQSPLYILFVASRCEVRFAWARDERRRLDAEWDWMKRRSVAIRFKHILTPEALDEIHDRIKSEARLHRRIHDMLGRASASEQVITSIDPVSLSNTDPGELYQLLITSGTTIVSSGFASEVEDIVRTLSPEAARAPRVQLVRAYAAYMMGRYQACLALLAEAVIHRPEISEEDQQFLMQLHDACDYQTGGITAAEYLGRLDLQINRSPDNIAPTYRLNQIRFMLLTEKDLVRRGQYLAELQSMVTDIPRSPRTAGTFELQANLLLLESQGHLFVLRSLEEFHHLRIRRTLKRPIDLKATLQNQVQRWREWEARVSSVVEASIAINHPIILADALSMRAIMRVGYVLNYRITGLSADLPTGVFEGLLNAATRDAEQAVNIYSQADQLEGQLRAKMHLADLLTLAGDTSGAQRLAEEVLPLLKPWTILLSRFVLENTHLDKALLVDASRRERDYLMRIWMYGKHRFPMKT